MKKKPMTAAEFAAELKQDPEYVAKQAERATRLVEAEVAERAAMDFLASRGYLAPSLSALVQRYAPIQGDLTESLLDLVAKVDHPTVLDSIVRTLGAAREGFDPSPLIRLFEQTESQSLRWAIANTLAEARPALAGQWILRALRNSSYGKAREMLALAAARTNPPEVANPALVDLLGELPAHAAIALGESGSVAELPALERAYSSSSGWQREEIGRALSVLRRRAGERI